MGNYQIINKAFVKTIDSDWKKRLEIEIGDKDSSVFIPRFKLKKWDDEVNFTFKYPEILGDVQFDGKTISCQKGSIKIKFYEKDANNFEMEIILNDKPDSNIFEFPISYKNLEFFYQPPLTQREMEDGAIRPENVVGSYAVYYKNCPPNLTNGKFYCTGKVLHIYRPKVIDNIGNWVWADLKLTNNRMTITIPQEFLDGAIYPIIIDPTFGYETIGVSKWSIENRILGSKFTITENGTADSITAYLEVTSYAKNSKCAIYKSSDLSLVGSTQQVSVPVGTTWRTFDFSTPKPSLTGSTEYILVAWSYSYAGYNYLYYDTGDTNQGVNKFQTYNGFPNPLSTPTYEDRKYSIYCTYTGAGDEYFQTCEDTASLGDNIVKTPSPVKMESISFSDDYSRIWDAYKTFTDTTNLSDQLSKFTQTIKTDTLNLSDSVESLKILTKELTETLNLSDSKIRDVFKSISNILNLSDVVVKGMSTEKSDTFGLSDNLAKQSQIVKSDTVDLSDTSIKDAGKLVPETLYLSDAALKDIMTTKTESFSLLDNLTKLTQIIKSDTLNLSDSLETLKILVKILSETLILSDSKTRDILKSIADIFNLSDVIIKGIATEKIDTLALSDELAKQPQIVKSDMINLSDTLAKDVEKIISDIISLSDVISKNTSTVKIEIISLTDNLIRLTQVLKTENIDLSDNISTLKILIKELTETLNLLDSIEAISETIQKIHTLGWYGSIVKRAKNS